MQKQLPGGVELKSVLKTFPKFARKHLQQSSYFSKVSCWLATSLKRELYKFIYKFIFSENTGPYQAALSIDLYLVGFFTFVEISEMLKKNRLEKLVSPVK